MRIGENRDSNQRKLKPPPNYQSRSMQFRLFVMAAMLMLVVTAAMEARDPNRWRWLTDLGSKKPPEEELDPKLSRLPVSESTEPTVGGTALPKTTLPDEAELSPLDRAWRSGWEELFPQVGFEDREFVYAALKAVRRDQPLSSETIAKAAEAMDHLDAAWSSYVKRAENSLKELSHDERASWDEVLTKLRARWSEEYRPALASVVAGQPLSSGQRTHLVKLQELLDQLQLHQIQDNTVWRASEREIWFRLIEKLQSLTPEELQQQSAGLLGYASLFKQPEAYRGKLVTVRGRAEAAYQMPAPKNDCGVKEYWIFWLLPEGGPASPIVVYSLEKPEGFPSIDFSELGKKKMPSLEDVEFTGYFLKRYAYQGQGGIYTAPLLLAKEPVWLKESGVVRALPSLGFVVGIVGVLALFATGLATFVYYQYRPGSDRKLADEIELPQG